MARNVVSYYELDRNLRAEIEAGDPANATDFVVISQLRARGLSGMLRRLRQLKKQSTIVVIADEGSRPLAGPLILLIAMSGSRDIQVLWPNRVAEVVSFSKVLELVYRTCRVQLLSVLGYWRARSQIGALQVRAQAGPRAAAGAPDRRILYLDGNLPIGPAVGGSVGHIRGVIDALVGSGFNVDYASGRPVATDLPGTRWLKVADNDFLAFPPELNCYGFNRRFDRLAADFAGRTSYAFIYQRMSVHNFTGAFLRRQLGIPLILEYNGSEAWTATNWNSKLRLHEMAVKAERACLANADLVVTVSSVLAAEIAATGVNSDRIVVHPNCVDPKIFDPARFSRDETSALRRKLRIRDDAKVATFIGTFGVWHGADFLAGALRHLIDEDRDWVSDNNLHFLLIGDGLKMGEVRALVGGEPYSDFVTLTGMIPQASAAAHLAASDVFLSPHVPNADGSTFFGSPTKLFEYMAMERPIVASDLAQIGEVLKGEYSGSVQPSTGPMAELFRAGSQEGLIAALRRVIENPAHASAMAKQARAAVLASYTWRHHVNAILARANQLGILARDD